MPADERKALSQARYDHALECLEAARNLLADEHIKSAANRAYYAVFHSMRSVLAYDDIDMKHHSGIISSFRRLYIKTGAFDVRLSMIISELYDLRTGSDYDDFFVVSGAEVAEQIENAEYFLKEIKRFLEQK